MKLDHGWHETDGSITYVCEAGVDCDEPVTVVYGWVSEDGVAHYTAGYDRDRPYAALCAKHDTPERRGGGLEVAPSTNDRRTGVKLVDSVYGALGVFALCVGAATVMAILLFPANHAASAPNLWTHTVSPSGICYDIYSSHPVLIVREVQCEPTK